MARYRGPRLKKCRAVGAVLPGLTTVPTLDRPFPPGEHGTRRRSKPSDYKVRLAEKQKARWHYGILEAQFQRYVKKASRMRGNSGDNLMLLLESRLDNLVWRLGLARTIPASRQLVVHGHVLVNGKRVDRPSFHVSPGDEISVREKSKTKSFVTATIEQSAGLPRPSWLEFDPAKATGKLTSKPDRHDLPFELNEAAIIEFYSQKL
ncbi:MAG: 30S ribosomal protein S4 [Alphaproteobacteria bacterium]|nr:30S ribosomal protein S4 [Alphaproteobacteria bacterium]MCB9690737.1 30S ribosomal protein S4 [Alphaproteobacteria bacterium]MCB9695071.1 30S ribosomal protein S4 [Alphaproteobacteria bacterium]